MTDQNRCCECSEELPANGQYIVCRAGYRRKCHFECTTMSQNTYRTRSNKARNAWQCHHCRKDKSVDVENKEINGSDSSNNTTLDAVLERIIQIQNDMKKNYEEIKEENRILIEKMDTLIKQNEEKDKEIVGLKAKINHLEQYSRRDTIEVRGIKEEKN